VLRGAVTRTIAHGATRIPGLKRLPVLKLLAIGEIALLARTHVTKLSPEERRRARLTAEERDELARLVATAEPRLFAGQVADKLSPVPLPKRLVRGPKREQPQRQE
jgi:hypothetical protein